jgi:hypothetical protein
LRCRASTAQSFTIHESPNFTAVSQRGLEEFSVTRAPIPAILVVKSQRFHDTRGFFSRALKQEAPDKAGNSPPDRAKDGVDAQLGQQVVLWEDNFFDQPDLTLPLAHFRHN